MRANNLGWPTFDGKYMNYTMFKKEWCAYLQTHQNLMGYNLMAKTLTEKCVNGEVRKMIRNVEDLVEIWDTLDTCYEKPKRYMSEALKPIIEFRRYKMADSTAIMDFYTDTLLRVQELWDTFSCLSMTRLSVGDQLP
jgi:hypothetical protein